MHNRQKGCHWNWSSREPQMISNIYHQMSRIFLAGSVKPLPTRLLSPVSEGEQWIARGKSPPANPESQLHTPQSGSPTQPNQTTYTLNPPPQKDTHKHSVYFWGASSLKGKALSRHSLQQDLKKQQTNSSWEPEPVKLSPKKLQRKSPLPTLRPNSEKQVFA